jgi:hypothetical protein
MPIPAYGNGRARGGCPRARQSLLEGGDVNPRARQSPLEGGVHPRAGRSPLEGGVCPWARRSLLEGIIEWAALVGRQGHRGVGHAPCVLSEACLALVFFAGFKWGFPSCLRGPPGLSPTLLVRCSGFQTTYVTKCSKYSQFFTTTSTYDTMITCQNSWFSNFIWILYNFKTFLPHGLHDQRTKCRKFSLISCTWS